MKREEAGYRKENRERQQAGNHKPDSRLANTQASSKQQAMREHLTCGGARWTIQFTRSCTALLPAVGEQEGEVGGALKAAQAGADTREGRWLMVGQSAMMTTGAAGAASSTYTTT